MEENEQNGGPGPSIREPSPRNPHSNRSSFETSAHHQRHPVFSSSHQQVKRQGRIGLPRRFSRTPGKSYAEETRQSIPSSPSRASSKRAKKRFKFPPWPTSTDGDSDHSGRNESSLYESDSDLSIHPTPSPYNDSDDEAEFRSFFSDGSSCLPRRRMKKKILDLKAKLTLSRTSFKWKSHDSQRNPRRSSEPPAGRYSFESQAFEPDTPQADEHESTGLRSILRTRSLLHRHSLREKRKTWA